MFPYEDVVARGSETWKRKCYVIINQGKNIYQIHKIAVVFLKNNFPISGIQYGTYISGSFIFLLIRHCDRYMKKEIYKNTL